MFGFYECAETSQQRGVTEKGCLAYGNQNAERVRGGKQDKYILKDIPLRTYIFQTESHLPTILSYGIMDPLGNSAVR